MDSAPPSFRDQLLAWWQASAPPALQAIDLLRIAQALAIAVLAYYGAGLARRAFDRATATSRADVHTRFVLGRALYLGILLVGVLTALDQLGVPLVSLLALLGAAGLAISLSLQDILKNFFAGAYLLFERPFRIGDEIAVRDFRGRVEQVGFRTTMLRTEENVRVLIPNAIIFAEVVANRTEARPTEAAEQAPAPTPAPDEVKR